MASDRRHTTKNQGWSQSSQKQSHRLQFGSILSLSLFYFFSDKLQLSLSCGGSHCTFNPSTKVPTLIVSLKYRRSKAIFYAE